MASVMWFRRDLRLADNPALVEACSEDGVLPLFVIDPRLWGPAGTPRRAYLAASLRSLDGSLRQRKAGLHVRRGDPATEVARTARTVGATRVHVAADHGPYGSRRDRAVERALAERDVELVRTESAYAVAPGRVTNQRGQPFKVFTPFARAWAEHGWRAPVDAPRDATWLEADGSVDLPEPRTPPGIDLPEAGEAAALRHWRAFLDERVARLRPRPRPAPASMAPPGCRST